VSHLGSDRSEREDELIDVRGNVRRCWWWNHNHGQKQRVCSGQWSVCEKHVNCQPASTLHAHIYHIHSRSVSASLFCQCNFGAGALVSTFS